MSSKGEKKRTKGEEEEEKRLRLGGASLVEEPMIKAQEETRRRTQAAAEKVRHSYGNTPKKAAESLQCENFIMRMVMQEEDILEEPRCIKIVASSSLFNTN